MNTNEMQEYEKEEIELLEFTLDEHHYGIRVENVCEILPYQKITPVPNSHPYIEGVMMPRDTMMTVVDLKRSIGTDPSEKKGFFIITNFQQLNLAFHVEQVTGIRRVRMNEIVQPQEEIQIDRHGVMTGVVKIDGKLVVMLDFEKIVADVKFEDLDLNIEDEK